MTPRAHPTLLALIGGCATAFLLAAPPAQGGAEPDALGWRSAA
jgi:hypothetical protein